MRTDARSTALWGITLTLIALVALNAAATFLVRGVRVDLTAERVYSLSGGVRTLLARLEEPVRLQLFWSQDAGESAPAIRAHAQRVREFLEALTADSGGLLSLEFIDPIPFSEAEDAARAAGLSQLQVDGVGTALTLGLVVLGPTDKLEAIPYLNPDQEASLTLRLQPPKEVKEGTYRFLVRAEGLGQTASLPITLMVGQGLPKRLSLEAELPVLKGPPTSSFRYRVTLRNESDQDLLVSLEYQAPQGFQVTFTPAFSSQQEIGRAHV